MSVDYILWGSAGHAKVLAALIAQRGDRVVALFDNDPSATPALSNVPLYIGQDGFQRWSNTARPKGPVFGLVAIGGARGQDRLALHRMFREQGLQVAPIAHPDASICTSASVGDGSHVLAQAVVATEAHLGEACIVNHNATVDHECLLGHGVHIAPGATLCGCVQVGDHAMIGAGAIILPRLNIGAGAIVGAGAVVTRDVPANITVTGNPARPA